MRYLSGTSCVVAEHERECIGNEGARENIFHAQTIGIQQRMPIVLDERMITEAYILTSLEW